MSRESVRRIRRLIKSHATQTRAYLAAVVELDRERRFKNPCIDHETTARDHLASLARIHALTAARLAFVLDPGMRG